MAGPRLGGGLDGLAPENKTEKERREKERQDSATEAYYKQYHGNVPFISLNRKMGSELDDLSEMDADGISIKIGPSEKKPEKWEDAYYKSTVTGEVVKLSGDEVTMLVNPNTRLTWGSLTDCIDVALEILLAKGTDVAKFTVKKHNADHYADIENSGALFSHKDLHDFMNVAEKKGMGVDFKDPIVKDYLQILRDKDINKGLLDEKGNPIPGKKMGEYEKLITRQQEVNAKARVKKMERAHGPYGDLGRHEKLLKESDSERLDAKHPMPEGSSPLEGTARIIRNQEEYKKTLHEGIVATETDSTKNEKLVAAISKDISRDNGIEKRVEKITDALKSEDQYFENGDLILTPSKDVEDRYLLTEDALRNLDHACEGGKRMRASIHAEIEKEHKDLTQRIEVLKAELTAITTAPAKENATKELAKLQEIEKKLSDAQKKVQENQKRVDQMQELASNKLKAKFATSAPGIK